MPGSLVAVAANIFRPDDEEHNAHRIKNVQLANFEEETVETNPGGSIAKSTVAVGIMEPTVEFAFEGADPDDLRDFMRTGTGSLQTYTVYEVFRDSLTGEEVNRITEVTGRMQSVNRAQFERGNMGETSYKIGQVSLYTEEFRGAQRIKYDRQNQILVVDGEDRFSEQRRLLGIG